MKSNKCVRCSCLDKPAKKYPPLWGVSAATINNFKAHFRKQGDQFPNNRGRRPGTPNKTAKKTTKTPKAKSNINLVEGATNNDYTYIIDGTKITFGTKPKSIMIGKKRMVVEL